MEILSFMSSGSRDIDRGTVASANDCSVLWTWVKFFVLVTSLNYGCYNITVGFVTV